MPFNITLQPSGHSFSAADSEPVLQSALDAGFGLPYGCRNGACGACKGKVLSGSVDYGAAQEHALSLAERAEGMALFCCAKPLSDLVLEVKEIGAVKDIPVKIMPCRVQHMEKLADDVMLLTLKLPTNERLQFLAGQYIEFLLKDGKRRAFSLANAPHDDELLQLHVRLIPGGTFTDHVFHAMHEKEILRFEGPHGSFFLREDSDKPIILVAAGTGFAPIKGVVEHAIHNGITRPMTIYWGARNSAGLYMRDLPMQWAAAHAHIQYVPVLSEPESEDVWSGRTGLVHEAVLADFPDLSGHQVYACGAPAMIDAAKHDFVAQGLPADEFFADMFSFAPPAPAK
ncbi:MAG: CDP-6-deoxy-delta-3,4-glucoseen reductase [Gammaproteobacteria bacterium]|nr:CDP-6-deoxy-delta-3,4-glucoseen reductase [Gammaproteobacteria bacterium]MBU1645202.1 CDP-6-deoxy-delta-3,4-glucoseen reductase [Gammaproteobacteria bacterium]MBU1973439.1 CDP-6-deoxy-delta-3,4-glucoseen reductase [Gammaproteobacteria bacterium]